jgi:Plasmid pRiA4b ORF-3-like protein
MPRRRAASPAAHTCTFRIRILGGFYAPPDALEVWREVELRADQTLADLGELIPEAFGFDDDHLWSFFLSGKPWDRASEYARAPDPDLFTSARARGADRLRVGDAPAGREFLFLFDYGDEWHFGVRLARTGEVQPGARYPRVVAAEGEAPPQYPQLEDDEDEVDDGERARLLERFAAWAEQRDAGDDVGLAASLLDYKADLADGDLGRWTADDLGDFLLGWCPARLVLPDEDVPRMVPAVRLFLDFLDDARLLDAAGGRPQTLQATLEWLAPRFAEAMADSSRFGPAKAVLSAMQAEGVDLEDRDAVVRFMGDFRLPPEVGLPGMEPPEFPQVELPTLEALQEAAATAPAVRRLRALVEWVGDGRKLTAGGNLTVADGRELAGLLGLVDPDHLPGLRVRSSQEIPGLGVALDWAKGIRLLRVHKGRLVPVKQQRHLLGDPLELLGRAVDALPSVDLALPLASMVEAAFPGGRAEALVDLLSLLYAPEEPVSLADLAGHVWEEHVEDRVVDGPLGGRVELWRLAAAVETAQLLGHVQALGLVETGAEAGSIADPVPQTGPVPETAALPQTGPGRAEPAPHAGEPAPYGGEPAPHAGEPMLQFGEAFGGPADAYLSRLAELPVRLTPLGVWQANVLLRAAGAVAPVVGELSGAEAAALIEGVTGYDERACRAELRAWCHRRGDAAAADLARYLRAAPGFEQRMLAFAALEEAGPAAEAEVRAMVSDGDLGPLARMWLVQRGLEDETSLDPATAVLLMAETLASILDSDGPAGLVEHLEQFGPPDEQATMLGDLWRARTPHAAAVLEATGKAHPDPKVAKAARKAAFKIRSSDRA